jgi:hypothetical protein
VVHVEEKLHLGVQVEEILHLGVQVEDKSHLGVHIEEKVHLGVRGQGRSNTIKLTPPSTSYILTKLTVFCYLHQGTTILFQSERYFICIPSLVTLSMICSLSNYSNIVTGEYM